VKKAARDSLTKVTALVSNKDVECFIPALIKALINPVEEVPNTVQLLLATMYIRFRSGLCYEGEDLCNCQPLGYCQRCMARELPRQPEDLYLHHRLTRF
jgi:hypothetical protein